MTTNPPPPGDPNEPDQPSDDSGLPRYGSVPPPSDGGSSYPPPPAGGNGYPPPGGGEPETNKLAMWSMIVGIVSLVLGICCGFIALAGIGAIIMGVMARRQIAAAPGAQKGSGMALAGIITGSIALVLLVVGIILLVSGVIDYSFTTTDFG